MHDNYRRDIDAVGVQPYAGAAIPEFRTEVYEDEEATKRIGKPVILEREMVKFMLPGDQNHAPDMRVNEAIRARYAKEYSRWKDGVEAAATGTPLDVWPLIGRDQKRELEAINIFTIESLANAPDAALMKVFGGFDLRRKALGYLEVAKNGAQSAVDLEERENDKRTIAALKKMVDEQSARVAELAVKAGESIADERNFRAEAEIATRKALPNIEIPKGWRQLSATRMKEIAAHITEDVPTTKAEVVALIDSYLAARSGAA